MKYKTERRETMGYLKGFALYISILILIVFIAGCGKSDKKQRRFKRSTN